MVTIRKVQRSEEVPPITMGDSSGVATISVMVGYHYDALNTVILMKLGSGSDFDLVTISSCILT